ncbi:hypothetical protein [Embleya sp. NPDC005971]|uniref:hypothetical protein n=1 Tax=Embleya sp. NPDC005971 TaxID=3156724 RepID=UPI0033F04533
MTRGAVGERDQGDGRTVVPWLSLAADASTRARYRAMVHVRGDADCWYWTRNLSSSGHAKFRAGSRTSGTSRMVTAHVLGWVIHHGAIPPEVVRHTCDEPSCQQPRHWVAGRRGENVIDYYARRHRGPLADVRGPRGRAEAIRAAIVSTLAADPASVEDAIAAAIAAGAPPATQTLLF